MSLGELVGVGGLGKGPSLELLLLLLAEGRRREANLVLDDQISSRLVPMREEAFFGEDSLRARSNGTEGGDVEGPAIEEGEGGRVAEEGFEEGDANLR